MIIVDIVKNILKSAKEHGYTNKQLCELLNKNPSYVSDWKSGKSKPKADEVLLLAQRFGVSVDNLLGNDTSMSDKVENGIDELFLHAIADLTDEELEEVKKFIEFLKSKR